MPKTEERELVRRTLDGDRDAFDHLYRTHHARIYAAVLGRTRDQDEAKDLVQITFIRAFLGLPGFRGEAALSTWLMQIAMNVCTTHYRSKQTRQSWVDTIASSAADLREAWEPARYEDPEEALDRKECQKLVRQGIRNLPEHYREIMAMRYVDDLSYPEITEQLQVPVGTVKTWLHRGRKHLEGTLQEWDMTAEQSTIGN